MTIYLEDRLYAETHEWVKIEGEIATCGISDFAQEELNDIVYVELPQVGDSFAQGETFGVIESVKAASDIYMPQLVNEDPYGAGWLIKLRVMAPQEAQTLLDAQAYEALCEET